MSLKESVVSIGAQASLDTLSTPTPQVLCCAVLCGVGEVGWRDGVGVSEALLLKEAAALQGRPSGGHLD